MIDFHDALHGSVHRRGTSTAIIEAKLAQQYFHREQTPLYGIFIDLRKAFDALDRDRCLEILEKYGVGNNIVRLIKTFWDQAIMVCRASGYYGEPFKAFRGTTQGGPVSPRIFNIMVDAVVREWLRQVLGDGAEVSETDVKRLLVLFYIDDGYMASPDRVFLQKSMDILVDIFERIGLKTNASKTKAMTCVPGKIKTLRSEETYARTVAGIRKKDWSSHEVDCHVCGLTLQASSLDEHLVTQHEIYRSKVINTDLVVEREPVEYFTEPFNWKQFQKEGRGLDCPVKGCPYTANGKDSPALMHVHHSHRHFADTVCVPIIDNRSKKKGPKIEKYPKCDRCGLQVQSKLLKDGSHYQSLNCREGHE